MNKIRKMKELDEILEELLKSKYNYMDERVKLSKLAQTCTAILSLMKSIVPPEPLFWANMSKGLRNYNEGKRDYRKEVLKRLEGE